MPNTAFVAIPDPQPDSQSLFASVKAIKQNLDIVLGNASGGAGFPRLYTTPTRPSDAKAGDLWVSPQNLLFYYKPNSFGGQLGTGNVQSSDNAWINILAYAPPDQGNSNFSNPTHSGTVT